jgi:two-component system, OmpR family, sensor kinase
MQPRDQMMRGPRAGDADPGRVRGRPTPFVPDARGTGRIAEYDGDVFLDILSHELRTPVTTIYGGAQLLASRDLSPARREALAADVRTEADRLYRLVEDLVILARSERGAILPVGEPVAMGHLVATAIAGALARHPELQIRYLGTNDAAADGADEILMTHVVRNLLDNAVHYGADSGPIEVIVEKTATEVSVRVVDHGEPPRAGRDPFALSANEPVTAAGRAGAGIGLYVADRLIQAMHGRMWAQPATGGGAEFGFSLALAAGSRTVDA